MFENLEQLIKTIRERKNSSPENSYTNKLLNDKNLSVAKVKEEVKSKKTVIRKDFKCSFPFKQLVINNEKQVLPCCTFWGEELALQKISKPEDLKAAWNSEKMRNLRQKHLDGNYADIPQCKNCVQGGLD